MASFASGEEGDGKFHDTMSMSVPYSPTASHTTSEASDEQRTLWQNAKKYRKVVYVTLGLASAILLYGYDYVVVGTVSGMPEFQKDFGERLNDEWIIPSFWLAIWNCISPVGAMIGSLFGGWFQDRVGRRGSLAFCSFLSALSVAVMYASYAPSSKNERRVLFLVGKFFMGGAVGADMAAVQTYLSEVLPPVLRGSGMAFFPAFTLLGQLTGALVIFGTLKVERGYATVFASQWPFSFLPIIVTYLIPESPVWYVRKKRMDEAIKAQARLDPPGTNTKAVVDKIAADIAHEEATATSATFLQCFDRRNFRRTFIVLWANSLPTVFGLQLLAKASYFLQIVGMKASQSIVFLILGILLGLLANVGSIWILARFERRMLILSGLGAATLLWTSMGIANCFHGSGVMWWTAVSMMLIITFCGLGVWPASFAVSGEASSLTLRSKTQGLGWTVQAFASAVAGFVLPYIFNPDAGNLRGKVGFTYTAACAAALVVSWWCIPDMKGRSVAAIDRMFEVGVPASKFRQWKSDGEEGRELDSRGSESALT